MSVSQSKSVLVVEDEPMIRMMAADAIMDAGIATFEAGCAEEALAIIEVQPDIGLVFTDVDLDTRIDGLSLAREIHRRRPDVTFIVTSGSEKFADDQIPDHGVFLPKPYQPAGLIKLVCEKLDHAGSNSFAQVSLRSGQKKNEDTFCA